MSRGGIRFLVALAVAGACGPSARDGGDATVHDSSSEAGGGGNFADPCSRHADCAAGYCVEPAGGIGGQCTRTCSADCPTGWDCLPVEFPESNVDLCVPATGRLCAPCANDGECPGSACLVLDGEPRCVVPCATSASCPTRYTCAPDPQGTHAGMYCQPQTGSCTCSAELSGALRTCNLTNPIGTCLGTQSCSGTGWSQCTASPPAAESCDGLDNDCDFVIDDGVGGGEPCVTTNSFGSCPGLRTCGGTTGFACNGLVPQAEACNSLDDNCNGTTDEGFAGLGGLCMTGVGACLRFGSMRCNAGGNGIECGAVAGAPGTETCNQADDNCNGQVDESYPTIGMACSSGVGACTRFGSFVCRGDGTGTQCSAVPGSPTGADTCNFLDDDCDGTVDNSFRDPLTGTYNTAQNCGACGIDCTGAFPGAQNATGGCVAAGMTAACGLSCSAGAFNLNSATSDGCEFILDVGAIYVSSSDPMAADDATCGLGPIGTGAGNHPCRSIAFANGRAIALARARVLVADGTYNEAVNVANGVSLLGAYRADTWERHVATTSTVIQGSQGVGTVHEAAVVASLVTAATVFEGFVVRGSFNPRAGGNSYAIYVASSNANLTIRNNDLFGGRGGAGAAGIPGLTGTAGAAAAPYTAAAYDAFQASGAGDTCAATNNRLAYGGGVQSCGAVNVSGGNGGGNNCRPQPDTQASTAASPATAGLSGPGGGAAGPAGVPGYDAEQQQGTCFTPQNAGGQSLTQVGADGFAGGSGQPASPVAGCSAAGGMVVAGHWTGGSAGNGAPGAHGGGGGGGGAGGGAPCNACSLPSMIHSLLGGHGGGAGSGGCGGFGGGSGGSGGAAFVVFVTGGAAPVLTGNTLTLGTGGTGGTGGIGGSGGIGGTGTQGGGTGPLHCTGKGGRGGDGGNGGAGAGGGGGCGGASFGIYTSGVGAPNLCATNTVAGGSAGPGGNGGFSAGSAGGNGVAGVVSNCTSI